MTTSQELYAKVAELERQLEEARKAADAQRAQEKSGIIVQINDLIAKHAILAHELTFPGSAKGKAPSVKSTKGTIGKPKYKNPANGATWTGHGKAPAWMPRDKEERKRFLIEQ